MAAWVDELIMSTWTEELLVLGAMLQGDINAMHWAYLAPVETTVRRFSRCVSRSTQPERPWTTEYG